MVGAPANSDSRLSRRLPVVSVGNLAMGGRGKTPVAALVAELLLGAGERPAILSRGYKRRCPEDGVVIVSDGRRQLADVLRGGDEPVLMARQVPGAAVLVCEVRAIAAALAEEQLDVTVHVLDDGLQHRSLRRDIDIVLIAPEDLDDRPFPFGRLRSGVTALRGVDAVIVDGTLGENLAARLRTLVDANQTGIFSLSRRLGRPWILGQRPGAPAPGHQDVLPGATLLAVAGIAAPMRFADALTAAGYVVADLVAFPDHHAYTFRDIKRIRDAARQAGASSVVTTPKDEVRLLPLRPLGVPVAVVPLEVAIDPAERFREWIVSRVTEVRRCRG